MGRIRSIKPGFCAHEEMAELPREVRLHFAMLWTYADDEGRGKDHPKLIKGEVWPLDDDVTSDVIEQWQCMLAEHGRIVRYEVDGRRYFEVVNFLEHQKPNRKVESKLPAPADGTEVQVSTHLTNNAVSPHEQRSEPAVSTHEQLTSGLGIGGEMEVEGFALSASTARAPSTRRAPSPKGDNAKSPKWDEAARRVAKEVYENRPNNSHDFKALAQVASQLLAAGHDERALTKAMCRASTVTRNSVEVELNRGRAGPTSRADRSKEKLRNSLATMKARTA